MTNSIITEAPTVMVGASVRPCARCHLAPREVHSYCRACKNQLAAESRDRSRPRERFEERPCDQDRCDQVFTWRSTHPSQLYCTKDCYTQGVLQKRQRARDQKTEAQRMVGKRWCGGCSRAVDLDGFSPSHRTRAGAQCRECARAAQQRYDTKNADKRRSDNTASQRRRRFRDVYGITLEFYGAEVERLQGRCERCRRERPLVVDHCHATGVYRGLLCSPCNTGIGQLGDTLDDARSAVAYLERFEARSLPA